MALARGDVVEGLWAVLYAGGQLRAVAVEHHQPDTVGVRRTDEPTVRVETELLDEASANVGLLDVVCEAGDVFGNPMVGVNGAVVAWIVLARPQKQDGPVVAGSSPNVEGVTRIDGRSACPGPGSVGACSARGWGGLPPGLPPITNTEGHVAANPLKGRGR